MFLNWKDLTPYYSFSIHVELRLLLANTNPEIFNGITLKTISVMFKLYI